MRARFEFTFHTVDRDDVAHAEVDPTLALLGSQGWEVRAAASLREGTVMLVLQRPLDEDLPLPDASTLSSALAVPLAAPSVAELERELPGPAEAAGGAGVECSGRPSARSSWGSRPGSPGCASGGSATTISGVIPAPSMSRPPGVR